MSLGLERRQDPSKGNTAALGSEQPKLMLLARGGFRSLQVHQRGAEVRPQQVQQSHETARGGPRRSGRVSL